MNLFKFIFLIFLQPEGDSVPAVLPPIRPPSQVVAIDVPNDQGGQIDIKWKLSPDDALLDGYAVYRLENGKEPQMIAFLAPRRDSTMESNDDALFTIKNIETQLKYSRSDLRKAERKKDAEAIKELTADIKAMEDYVASLKASLMSNFTPYTYKVAAVRGEEEVLSEPSAEVKAYPQWFHLQRINVLIAMVFFFFLVLFFISRAKRGKELFLRKIAGLEAIDEAVGRATEMGRPILFVPGLSDISDIATIAALNILQGIAKKTAQYDTPIIVPNRDPIVYTVAREIVKEAYSDVGRPDAFNPDSVFYMTGDQFAFVSGVNGIMLREKPATNFFLGMFYAESLLLAETGNISGAIQIAGTDASSQLPFFITACDYTIIGEELYAASAYLSRNPELIGTIKAQDWGKATIAVLLVILSLLAAFGLEFAVQILQTV
ncbi:hypothetical protein GX441_05970 [bacterium]|nr:hypothetical protein [bacterium]